MEIPSSSPVYTPLKPRARRDVDPGTPINLFAEPTTPTTTTTTNSEPTSGWSNEPASGWSNEPSNEPGKEPTSGLSNEPASGLSSEPTSGWSNEHEPSYEHEPSNDDTAKYDAQIARALRAARMESVVRSSDEDSDTDEDVTHVDDEFHWSLAQRPPPEPREAIVEDSLLEPEPLELPGSTSSAFDGEETVLSDDDDGQSTDGDAGGSAGGSAGGVGIYDGSPIKSTQNYLSELLTDSLLESLPLPPDRKQHLRNVATIVNNSNSR